MLQIKDTSVHVGKFTTKQSIPFEFTGVSSYEEEVVLNVVASCGCTTVKDLTVGPKESFSIKGIITPRSSKGEGIKSVTIKTATGKTVKDDLKKVLLVNFKITDAD